MPTITEQAAQRYATAVVAVLAEDFISLRHDVYTESALRRSVARHVENPGEPFEACIDAFTRNWRLHREDAFKEQWRVKLACHKDNWTDADIQFSDSVNARLRAIKMEG